MISIGIRIKQARKEKGLTQAELAGSTISRSLLSLIENGLSYPSMQTLEYIAQKLQKPISYFLSASDNVSESSIQLIGEVEILLESEEYPKIIEMITNFFDELPAENIELIKSKLLAILYTILGAAYYHTNSPDALYYLEKGVGLFDNSKYNSYCCKALNYLGLLMYKRKDYERMEHYLLKADCLFQYISNTSINLKLNITYNLALAYYYKDNFEHVIELLNKSLLYCKKYELYYNYGDFNILLALSHRSLGDFNQAIHCNIKAIDYYKLTENKNMLNRSYVNLSIVYRYVNDYYNSINYINDAIAYFQQFDDIEKAINAKVEKIITLFIFKNECATILNSIAEILDGVAHTSAQKGELLAVKACIEFKYGNYDNAYKLFLEAESLLADKNSCMTIFVYNGLSKLHEYIGDIQSAYKYLNKASELTNIKPYFKSFIWENSFNYYFLRPSV